MKVTYKNNTLVINTGINAEVAKNSYSALELRDEKTGDRIYSVTTAFDSNRAEISKYGITCNNIVDGNLAVQILLPVGTKKEAVLHDVGAAILVAKKYIPAIIAQTEATTAEMATVFDEADEDVTDAE